MMMFSGAEGTRLMPFPRRLALNKRQLQLIDGLGNFFVGFPDIM